MEHLRTSIAVSGLVFVVLFVVGGILLGELFGAFADSDSFFLHYFADQSLHARDLVGGHLLVAASLTLLVFLHLLTDQLQMLGGDETGLRMAQSTGLVGISLLLAGTAATLTVPMSKVFGRLTDDEPLTSSAVSLAPQLGYVLIFFPAMWALAFAIALITWSMWQTSSWSRVGRWLAITAVFLLLTSWLTFNAVIVLPIWVLAMSFWVWRSQPDAQVGRDAR